MENVSYIKKVSNQHQRRLEFKSTKQDHRFLAVILLEHFKKRETSEVLNNFRSLNRYRVGLKYLEYLQPHTGLPVPQPGCDH